jgi:hypothetical protein
MTAQAAFYFSISQKARQIDQRHSISQQFFKKHRHVLYTYVPAMVNLASPSDRNGFGIAVICATKVEADAAEAMFDKV